MGVVKESIPEVMTYEVEMAVKYIKKGLGKGMADRRECISSGRERG